MDHIFEKASKPEHTDETPEDAAARHAVEGAPRTGVAPGYLPEGQKPAPSAEPRKVRKTPGSGDDTFQFLPN